MFCIIPSEIYTRLVIAVSGASLFSTCWQKNSPLDDRGSKIFGLYAVVSFGLPAYVRFSDDGCADLCLS